LQAFPGCLPDEGNGILRAFPGAPGILLTVKIGRGQVFAAVEGQFPIPAQAAGMFAHNCHLFLEKLRENLPVGFQNLADIVNMRSFDPEKPEQRLQCQFDNLLRFPHDIGPCLALMLAVSG